MVTFFEAQGTEKKDAKTELWVSRSRRGQRRLLLLDQRREKYGDGDGRCRPGSAANASTADGRHRLRSYVWAPNGEQALLLRTNSLSWLDVRRKRRGRCLHGKRIDREEDFADGSCWSVVPYGPQLFLRHGGGWDKRRVFSCARGGTRRTSKYARESWIGCTEELN